MTGLTEKLNQKRLKTAMDFSANQQLGDLQVTNLLGEGGFAKVFRGLWRGLTVGIKIVVDDGKNEKMVMKNAHEIAILSTLSHPHVTQVGSIGSLDTPFCPLSQVPVSLVPLSFPPLTRMIPYVPN